MNYGDLQTTFISRLNRRDCTTLLAQSFLQDSLKRIQRDLRVPAMEKSIVATIGNVFSGGLAVPGDLIQLIDITNVGESKELDRTTLQEVLYSQKYENTGCTRMFTRRGSQFLIAPLPNPADQIQIDYYAAFQPLAGSTDTNVLTDIASDLILQGALVFGCTHFSDKRKVDFESDYMTSLNALNDQAIKDELTGNAQVAPALNFDED